MMTYHVYFTRVDVPEGSVRRYGISELNIAKPKFIATATRDFAPLALTQVQMMDVVHELTASPFWKDNYTIEIEAKHA